MIIGINGYIGSGKDTVGKIIQYLDSEKRYQEGVKKFDQVVTLSDRMRPESFEEWIAPKIHNGYDIGGHALYQDSGWQIKKFAGKLKQIASLMTGIPIEKFEDQEFKKTYLGEEWNYSVALDRDTMLQEYKSWEEKPMTVRELLQKLGTEAIRDGLHTNAWVNALFSDYKKLHITKGIVAGPQYPDWIITDTRFPNEAQVIKDRGGIVIRVNRNTSQKGISWDIFKCADIYEVQRIDEANLLESDDKARELAIKEGYEFNDSCNIYKVTKFPSKHPSETSLDDWNFDYVIENNGTIDELIEKVKIMLTHFELLK